MSANPFKAFGLSCPNGGDFHICENTKREFIGCCTTDPCADGSGLCQKANLRAASFSESSYLDIPPQSCDSTGGDDHFYTCTANDPPFIGCCTINPCVNMTCPSANLRAAVLSSDHDDRASFLSPSTSSSSGKPSTTAKPGSNGLPSGAIAGIVVSVVVLLLLVAGFVLWRRYSWSPFGSAKSRHRDNSSSRSLNDSLVDSPQTPGSGHTNSPAFSDHSHLSDPRSAFYSPTSASPLPSYKQYQSAGHHGQWHMSQSTQPLPPVFHPRHENSGTWPFQSPLYETHPNPSPNIGLQSAWPSHQPVHELLAEVQSSKPELATEERVQELTSSCVVQPLRPPPPVKGVLPDGMPDSPTLGPPLSGDRVHPKVRAALEARSNDRSPTKSQGAQDKSLTETPKTSHARSGQLRKDQANLSFDNANFI